MLDLLSELNATDGHTIVIVTHDPAAASIAGRVVFLRDGEVAGEVEGGRPQADRIRSRLSSAPGAIHSSLTLRQLRTRRLRALLTTAGIVLGVAMVFGVLLLSATIRGTFPRPLRLDLRPHRPRRFRQPGDGLAARTQRWPR